MNDIPKEKFVILGADKSSAELLARPHISYLADAWRRFRENKVALAALFILSVLVIMCIIGPALCGKDFAFIEENSKNLRPSAEHWFGTDKMGRDLFARVWMGGRVSIIIGITGAFICAVIGCIYGGLAAYFGGKVDTVLMRIVEVLISIPYLIVVILMSVVIQKSNIFTLLLAMCLTGWCGTARLVRAEMLSVKSSDYVLAAENLGVPPMKIIIKHLIPNTLNVIIVSLTFDIPNFIFSEAFLSYVGLGIKPPDTSWGALCNAAQSNFMFYPYQLFFPGVMIALTMLCFTLLGDGLRDALDPKLRK